MVQVTVPASSANLGAGFALVSPDPLRVFMEEADGTVENRSAS